MKNILFIFVIVVITAFTAGAQVNLNLGLRAYYPFSGNANDVSGNNNNPVFNNATLTADRLGNPNSAYHFNGTNNYMRILNSPTLNMANKMSISLWVKPTGWYTGQCYNNMMLMKGDADYLPGNYSLRFSDVYNGCSATPSTTEERFYDGSGAIAQLPIVQLNQWYSVIITYDGTTARLYINCVLQATSPSILTFTNAYDIYLGHLNNAQFPYWLNGDLDEVRIYDRALNVDEVKTLGGCNISLTCNNWLSTPTQGSYVTTGDLDITGNQLTVEAVYNRTAPLNGGLYYGHLVSKHSGSADVNYALLPNGCEITTTTGYKSTFQSCAPDLNKTYHVAMVYDGINLKYYRNGFLLSQVACTGNMINNNLQTTIAQFAGGGSPPDNQFRGYTNEVRIWNVARTQAELQTFMNGSLPNPTTQTGLRGYYTFDNLLNKQGNAAFNATLNGASAINTTNTNCTFIPDSCAVSCNNWLRTQAVGQSVTVGDLDVSGNQITIEGNFNCSAYPVGTGNIWEEIVSKHIGAADCNYALRMNLGAITTTNGFFRTPPFLASCDSISLNKTYHAAMVYNGSTLKFYRNGFLMSQVAATGNLVLNNLLTTIGDYADNNPQGTNFRGYLNEIRIWNVARTQSQLQTYMNSSLPNPATQTGLLAYYTFDNLVNKQGNPAWNGTLNGGATINNINPNCSFVADSCVAILSCNNWLSTPTSPSYAVVGDLDVTGNQLTVEAMFNRVVPPPTPGNFGFLVSKHTNAFDNNYALWTNGCALTTTTNPQVLLSSNCDIDLDKTYHVAMVYDGTTLKYYRNGFLHSQAPMSGNLINNNLLTHIAQNPTGGGPIYPFLGRMNEVRIWNVARSQSQIQANMNIPLPNPTTTPGLLGYYAFDNLLNKQGNTSFNATLNGAATINSTNPQCIFVADSCFVAPGISGIINDYTPVLGLDICSNKITVEDGVRFNTGDTVLMIQMKGAIIDSTNTAAFGTITDYKNAGNYEFNYVKGRVGNVIELRNALTRQYDIPAGKVQLVRVPYYTAVNINGTLTCLPWDGRKGGVLAFNVLNSLTLNADLDVSGRGFNGGIDPVSSPPVYHCNENQFYYPANPDLASGKGEGIADISAARSFGKGALANGGGGGVSHNSGGGGGGNIGAGGFGGYQLEGAPCNIPVPFDNRGLGGKGLNYSNALNKIFLGGGGGAGHTNNPQAFESKGGNGGGIIIVSAGSLASNTRKIIANGSNAPVCSQTTSACHEGMGGGGAAGTVLLQVNSYSGNTNIEARGGKGGDMPAAGFTKVGPGGGGSGGPVWLSNATLPGNVTVANGGGLNGVCPAYANDPWGSTPGTAGQNIFNLALPYSLTAFQKNIDSVRIKDSLTICNSYDFKGLAYINTSSITTWQWFFGDGGTANTQNTTHTYTTSGAFNVKLVVSDINGCKDSITKIVNVVLFTANAGNDTTICSGTPATVMLQASAGTSYAWTPAINLNNPAIQNPIATINNTTRFYVTITNAQGCTAMDSVTVSIATAIASIRYTTVNALTFQPVQLQARNLGGNSYVWTPAVGLNNNLIINPVFSHNQSQEYKINIRSAAGCNVVDTLLVAVKGTKGIYVPKGFSPNGDGTNDRLYPILVGIRELHYFRVYNRWGNLVFETKSGNPATGWNGTINGYQQPVESYTWTAEGTDIDGIVIKKSGNTFLIR